MAQERGERNEHVTERAGGDTLTERERELVVGGGSDGVEKPPSTEPK